MSRPQALWNAVLAALLVAVALSGIFWLDSPAGTIAANVALGLLIGTLLGLTGRGRAFALLIIVLLLAPLLARFVLVGAQLVWGPWLFSLLAGWFIGTTAHGLTRRAAGRQRTAMKSTLKWYIADRGFAIEDPSAEQIEAKIRKVDGGRRSLVTIDKQFARLEVCGNAQERLVIFRSLDTRDDGAWSVALDYAAQGGDVPVQMGLVQSDMLRTRTVDLAHALAHVADFLSDEPSSQSGNWWTGEDVLLIKPSFP